MVNRRLGTWESELDRGLEGDRGLERDRTRDRKKDRTCQFTAESRCKLQNNRDKVSETDCGGGTRDKLFERGRGKASMNKGN